MSPKKTKSLLRRRRRRDARIWAAEKAKTLSIECGEAAEIIAAESSDGEGEKVARFRGVVYSGGKMSPGGWYRDEPLILDAAGMEFPNDQRIPAHRDHDPGQIVGHTDEIIAKNRVTVAGVVSGTGGSAAEVVGNSKNGFPWQMSVGANLLAQPEFVAEGDTVFVNGRKHRGPVYVARKSVLKEASFVSLGADSRTSAVAASDKELDMNFQKWLKAKGFDADELSDDQLASLQAMYDAEVEATRTDDETEDHPEDKPDKVEAEDSGEGIRNSAADAYELQAVVQKHLSEYPEVAAKALREGWGVEMIEAQAKIQEITANYSTPIHTKSKSNVTNSQLECAMHTTVYGQSSAEAAYGEVADQTIEAQRQGHIPRTAGLRYLLHETIRAAGNHIHPSENGDEMIRAAFRAEAILASSGASTMSLSGVLSNVANKRLLQSYNRIQAVWRRIARVASHPDFKQNTKYRTFGVGDLLEVKPNGEIVHTEYGEGSYTNQVGTYARMLVLPRTMIINDDLGEFLKIPTKFGDTAAKTLQKLFFTELLDNATFFKVSPASGDGYNQNRITGGSSALSLTSIGDAETKFEEQVDPNGDPILVEPGILLVPPKLKRDAINFTRKTTVTVAGDPTSAEQVRVSNEYEGEFDAISSPYMGPKGGLGGTDTNWLMCGAPGAAALMEVAFLNGADAPMMDNAETDFNTLGMQWRAVYDFGVAKEDERMGVWSDGA